MSYETIYEAAKSDPEKFWMEAANQVEWITPPTKALFEDFVSILSDCKNLILMEIYPASEEPIKGYESEDLIKQIKAKNSKAILVNGIKEAYKEMQKFNQDNFIFLTQGAGNTSALAAKFKT